MQTAFCPHFSEICVLNPCIVPPIKNKNYLVERNTLNMSILFYFIERGKERESRGGVEEKREIIFFLKKILFLKILLKLIYLFIYFEREGGREGEERERERERKKERERIPSRLHTVSTEPHAGPDPRVCEIMTRAEIKS